MLNGAKSEHQMYTTDSSRVPISLLASCIKVGKGVLQTLRKANTGHLEVHMQD